MEEVLARAKRIKLLIFDVDGVLTDGGLHFTEDGQENKVFNSRDGHGIKMLQKTGVEMAVISGRKTKSVSRRMEGLGIQHVYLGILDKLPVYRRLIGKLGLKTEEVAYLGDDVVDLQIMLNVGFAVAVADSHQLVIKHAHWVTPSKGGRGAGRDACEMIMQAQGTLEPYFDELVASANKS